MLKSQGDLFYSLVEWKEASTRTADDYAKIGRREKVPKVDLSVIVPVYNAEKYLEECLDSILKQTCMPEKIILVDDGSTDGSSEICNRYCQEYADIIVFHQKNSGVAFSRKRGIKYVETEYVTFVDADDWIDDDLFERTFMGTRFENADVVITGFFHEYGDYCIETVPGLPEGVYSRKEFHTRFLSNYIYDYQRQKCGIIPSLCAKFYRTNVLKQDLCEVDSRLTLGEDGAVVYPLLAKATKISISSYCGYHYRYHKESKMARLNTTDFQQVELLQKYLYRKFDEIGLLEIGQQQIDYYLLVTLQNLIKKIYGIEISESSVIFPNLNIPLNSKIVIYGAGKIGMAYMRELFLNKQYSIVLWVDWKKRGCCYGYEIVEPQKILEVEYDIVLIAIANADISKEVKSYLMRIGVPSKKIIWFPEKWR